MTPATRTQESLYLAFVAEAKAHFRLLAFAERAAAEELPPIAALFRAVAEAERVHATRHLELLAEVVVQDSEANLRTSFEREQRAAGVHYPAMIAAAQEEGERPAAISFSHARDVEEQHASLYKRALDHLLADTVPAYAVCQLCGYIAEGSIPDVCPVCGAPAERFRALETEPCAGPRPAQGSPPWRGEWDSNPRWSDSRPTVT